MLAGNGGGGVADFNDNKKAWTSLLFFFYVGNGGRMQPRLQQGPHSERDSIMPCAVKSSFNTGLQILTKTGFHFSNRISLLFETVVMNS